MRTLISGATMGQRLGPGAIAIVDLFRYQRRAAMARGRGMGDDG
jgi:hypothetical protein